MRKLFFLFLLLPLSGCAYNYITITADNGSSVECTSAVDKPVDIKALTEPLKGSSNTVPFKGI